MADDTNPKYQKEPTRIGGEKLVLPPSEDGPPKRKTQGDRPARGRPSDKPARASQDKKPYDKKPYDKKPYDKKSGDKPVKKKPNFKAAIMSRQICFNILVAVSEGEQLDLVLNANEDLPKLEDRDRRFVRLLATTCLRRRGQIEKTLAPMMPRRPFGAQENANLILLMGAVQLLILKTGPHAAVDSTVELMRQEGFDRLTGLANAVMRRLTREGEALFKQTKPLDNIPNWLRISWVEAYGIEKTSLIAEMAMKVPTLDISVAEDVEGWAKKLDGSVINNTTIRREFDGDPSKLPGFADGAWWVQDAAAALPAKLLGDVAGKDVIDVCAAPGGKTAQLIAAGGSVTALDAAIKRLDRMRRNLKRLGMKADLKQADGRTYVPDFPVDAILLDAPCSATGTLRRRPDILGSRNVEDIAALQSLQWELTTSAIGWLKPGGTLVYATCSLQPEEGETMIAAIIEAGEGSVEIDPITPEEAGEFAPAITADGTMRIIPSDFAAIGGVDGFYIARLKSLV